MCPMQYLQHTYIYKVFVYLKFRLTGHSVFNLTALLKQLLRAMNRVEA